MGAVQRSRGNDLLVRLDQHRAALRQIVRAPVPQHATAGVGAEIGVDATRLQEARDSQRAVILAGDDTFAVGLHRNTAAPRTLIRAAVEKRVRLRLAIGVEALAEHRAAIAIQRVE